MLYSDYDYYDEEYEDDYEEYDDDYEYEDDYDEKEYVYEYEVSALKKGFISKKERRIKGGCWFGWNPNGFSKYLMLAKYF